MKLIIYFSGGMELEMDTIQLGILGAAVVAVLLVVLAVSGGAPATGAASSAGAGNEIYMESYVNVIDGKYYPGFTPKEITVKKGEKIRLKINATSGNHNFNFDEFGVKAETPTGQVTVVEFTADQAGEFQYYCSKPGHRAAGHFGTLKVVE